LIKTPITETSSKLIAIIGVVAIWAAKETATWAWWRRRRVANSSVSEASCGTYVAAARSPA
jgi:hypothetical protein